MRKLIGSLATWCLPVVALAMLSGCQRSPSSTSTVTETRVQHAALAGEKADVLDDFGTLCGGAKCGALADGTASISGNAKIDAFFQTVLSLKGAAASLDGEVNATLGEMAALVGAEVGASADVTAANIQAAFEGDFGAQFEGGLGLKYEPAQCSVKADVAVSAKAQCEAMVDPGSVEVECKGECVAKADVMASCEGGAMLECKGTAPSFACEGSCEGSCELNAGVACEGTCEGTCDVSASGDCDGECSVALDSDGKCGGECKVRAGGKCEGECKGSCKLSGGASCEGQCKGECTYTAPSGGCEASAQASCKASGNASVNCKGECKGEATPPAVSAECEASVKAQAQFSAECTPPDIALDYKFAASLEGDANIEARAELSAKVQAFAKAYGKLVSKQARIEGILKATAGLGEAGVDAVSELASSIGAEGNLHSQFNIACAVRELTTEAPGMITGAIGTLEGTVEAVITVTGAVQG